MKLIWITVFLSLGFNSLAQKQTGVTINDSKFSCEKVVFDSEQNEMTLSGNVGFRKNN